MFAQKKKQEKGSSWSQGKSQGVELPGRVVLNLWRALKVFAGLKLFLFD
jgi:hypothetical protein